MGRGTSVILQEHQPAWLPCIKLLRDADVNVYGTVNGRKGAVFKFSFVIGQPIRGRFQNQSKAN